MGYGKTPKNIFLFFFDYSIYAQSEVSLPEPPPPLERVGDIPLYGGMLLIALKLTYTHLSTLITHIVMSQNTFGRQYTVAQFLKLKDTPKFRFNKMVTKKDAEGKNEPIYYKNEDKSSTGIQKIAFNDVAGNFLGTLSRTLAPIVLAGNKLQLERVIISERLYDAIDPETGDTVPAVTYSMHYYNESPNELDVQFE